MPPIVSTSGASPEADGPGVAEGNEPKPASKLAAGLHIVATPIGNAADITLRALDTLKQAHVIACEDTRVTGKLMHLHGIKTPLVSYHEHNAAKMRPILIERMKAGEVIALVTDAGTPLVSDPGYKLVRACVEEGVAVTSLPGASAPIVALTLSGLPSDRFLFAGFLPNKKTARRAVIGELMAVPATLVFFESPQRLPESLGDLAELLGPREAAVTRELTKLYEEVRRGTLPELAAHYAEAGPPRGEIVLVIGPPGDEAELGDEDIDKLLLEALGRLSVRDAAADIAARTGRHKRDVYARALELARTQGGGKGR